MRRKNPVLREQCGTYGGAQTHLRYGEDTCDPCRRARNEYMAQYRQTLRIIGKPDRTRQRQKIREKALRVLGQRYPNELEQIVRELSRESCENIRQDPEHPSIWWVRSASDPELVYRVELGGEYTTCTCKHGLNNPGEAKCWHAEVARRA